MTGKIITIKLPLLLLAVIIAITTITSCSSNEEKNEKPFVFLGEGYENGVFRSDNFDKDTIVTPKNISALYNEYNVETLFNGSYYLIHSKKSYTTSRYLSRLIQMKEGKQVAAKTFYDSEIDANKVIKLRDKLIIGLNSLRVNNYDSTFHQSTHQCRVVVLSDSLTPIVAKKFYSQKGHTYIESLMQISDSTFICAIASGEVEINPYSHYQFKARKDLSIVGQPFSSNQYQYEIRNEDLDLSKPDWGNDLSDNYLSTLKKETVENNSAIPNDSVQRPISSSKPQKPRIPKDFVLVSAGILKNEHEWNNDKEVYYNVSIDSFYVCKYELTQCEFKRVMGNILKENYTWNIYIDYKDATVVKQGDSIPVVGTYQEFAEYCNRRSVAEGYDGFYDIDGSKVRIKHDGNGYRLLNHFEWTYAAKGGNANEKYSYSGSNKIGEVAWYGGNSKYRPHEVGKKKANSLGLYDMSGNVSEMLLDDPKSPYRLIGGEGFDYWVNLGPHDILGMYEKNRRNGTRIALVPKGMQNRNTNLTWKYHW